MVVSALYMGDIEPAVLVARTSVEFAFIGFHADSGERKGLFLLGVKYLSAKFVKRLCGTPGSEEQEVT
jgi:hypothetical protein